MKTLIGLAGLALLAAGNYHSAEEIPVPGNGGWDYLTLDTAARRLYVSHGTEVNVLDADAGTVVGKIGGRAECTASRRARDQSRLHQQRATNDVPCST